jgi:CubicO group peptidase (beta-lactamase class C family)
MYRIELMMYGMSGARRAVSRWGVLSTRHRRNLRWTVGFLAAATVVIAPACTASPGQSSDRPGGAQLSSSVAAFLDRFDESGRVRAVLVSQHGRHVFQLWRGEQAHDYVNVGPMAASLVSMLIGIAIDRSEIPGLDAPLGQLLPAYRDAMSAEVAAIPLEAVLSHTAGFPPSRPGPDTGEPSFATSPDWVRAIIADRAVRGPGDGSFAFSNAGAHLLAAVLDQATPGSVVDYARARLLDPLGIPSRALWVDGEGSGLGGTVDPAEGYFVARFVWPADPQGVQRGAGPLALRPEDLLTLGQLYLDHGRWQGHQLVSSQWVDSSTATPVQTGRRPSGFGLGWWVDPVDGRSLFLALGHSGTVIAVMPDRDLELIVVSEDPGHTLAQLLQQFHTDEAINLIEYVLLPHLG